MQNEGYLQSCMIAFRLQSCIRIMNIERGRKMEKQLATERIEHKANIFKTLSMLFKQPDSDIEYYIEHLKISVEALYPHLTKHIIQLEQEFMKYKQNITVLKAVHAKLFIGPFDVLAPPYSSIYLHEGRNVYGESTYDAMKMYSEAGVAMAKEFKDLPDHISVELEFIYYLYFLYREKNEQQHLRQISHFIDKHLIRWVPLFAKKIIEENTSQFYLALANALNEIISSESSDMQMN